MRRIIELTSKDSCINKAGDNEMTFVLLGRDAAAPVAIMKWVEERIRLGKNTITDQQICEAVQCADTMENERKGLWIAPMIKRDNTVATLGLFRILLILVIMALPLNKILQASMLAFLCGTAFWQLVESRFLQKLPR